MKKYDHYKQNKARIMTDLLFETWLDWTEKCEPEQRESFEVYVDKLGEEIMSLTKKSHHETKNK